MAYNTKNVPGMSYEEYRRAMDRKRMQKNEKKDELPEAFLKLFDKHNVQVPETLKRPKKTEMTVEEVFEAGEALFETDA